MQYMLLMNETKAEFDSRQDPEKATSYWGGWSAFIGAMRSAGIIVNGDVLQSPAVSTTVRIRNGKRLVQDGPFADTKEQLAGYLVIEVKDLDEALSWAAKAPCASEGSVEVRPVLVMQPPQ